MFNADLFKIYLVGFIPLFFIALVTWLISLWKRDVSIVDSLWSVFFLAAAISFAIKLPLLGPRGIGSVQARMAARTVPSLFRISS